MHQLRPNRLAFLLTALGFAACSADAPATQNAATETGSPEMTATAPSLHAATALAVVNARMPIASLVTAGQVTPEQLEGLTDAGFQHFISLRPATEDGAGWEEGHALSDGVDFHRIPVAGSAGLTRENVEALDRLLDEAGDEGTVLYCASSNRVGALLALRAFWLDEASAEEALELGRSAGLRSLESTVSQLFAEGRN